MKIKRSLSKINPVKIFLKIKIKRIRSKIDNIDYKLYHSYDIPDLTKLYHDKWLLTEEIKRIEIKIDRRIKWK